MNDRTTGQNLLVFVVNCVGENLLNLEQKDKYTEICRKMLSVFGSTFNFEVSSYLKTNKSKCKYII